MVKKVSNAYEIKQNISDLPKPSNDGPAAFYIEPTADLDTVMALLNANYLLHWCIIGFIYCIIILLIAKKVVNNQ